MKTRRPKPELFELVEEYFNNRGNLNNIVLIACQHLLGSQLEMFRRLVEKHGLLPENCWIIGKSYSSNPRVFKKLKELGCYVDPASLEFEHQRPFDEWFDEKIDDFVNTVITSGNLNKFERIVILDDGGHLISRIHDSKLPSEKLAAIEQTSSGYNHLKTLYPELRFGVVMVARTSAKLIYETPFITKLGLERTVRHIRRRYLFPGKILVVGQGPIGTSLSKRLKHLSINHRSFDIKDSPEGLSSFLAASNERLEDFNVIIGTTGAKVFKDEDLKKMHPEVSLISFSSSDREFPSAFIRSKNKDLGIHSDYFIGKRCLVNAGFPITFYGNYHELSPKLIEITCSMLYAATLLSASGIQTSEIKYLGDRLSEKFIGRLNQDDYDYDF